MKTEESNSPETLSESNALHRVLKEVLNSNINRKFLGHYRQILGHTTIKQWSPPYKSLSIQQSWIIFPFGMAARKRNHTQKGTGRHIPKMRAHSNVVQCPALRINDTSHPKARSVPILSCVACTPLCGGGGLRVKAPLSQSCHKGDGWSKGRTSLGEIEYRYEPMTRGSALARESNINSVQSASPHSFWLLHKGLQLMLLNK